MAGAVSRPRGHGEVGVQVDPLACPSEALRHRADERDGVQHLVVEREVVDRKQVQPCGELVLAVLPPDGAGRREKVRGLGHSGPITFKGSLELPMFANPEIARDRRNCHAQLREYASPSRRSLRQEKKARWDTTRPVEAPGLHGRAPCTGKPQYMGIILYRKGRFILVRTGWLAGCQEGRGKALVSVHY